MGGHSQSRAWPLRPPYLSSLCSCYLFYASSVRGFFTSQFKNSPGFLVSWTRVPISLLTDESLLSLLLALASLQSSCSFWLDFWVEKRERLSILLMPNAKSGTTTLFLTQCFILLLILHRYYKIFSPKSKVSSFSYLKNYTPQRKWLVLYSSFWTLICIYAHILCFQVFISIYWPHLTKTNKKLHLGMYWNIFNLQSFPFWYTFLNIHVLV